MLDRKIDKLRLWLEKWHGASVSVVNYSDEFERLVLVLKRDSETIGVSLFHPVFISGPFSWAGSRLVFAYSPESETEAAFSLTDQAAGFAVRFGGPISIGDGELVVPSD